jgi:hypothetical protein
VLSQDNSSRLFDLAKKFRGVTAGGETDLDPADPSEQADDAEGIRPRRDNLQLRRSVAIDLGHEATFGGGGGLCHLAKYRDRIRRHRQALRGRQPLRARLFAPIDRAVRLQLDDPAEVALCV